MDKKVLDFTSDQIKKDLPDFAPGQTIRVHQKVKEGDKTRIQIFEGLIIAIKGNSPANRTITVRKISSGVGVERIFPVNSPLIEKFEVTKSGKVRRAKLYYIRKKEQKIKDDTKKQEIIERQAKKFEDRRKKEVEEKNEREAALKKLKEEKEKATTKTEEGD